MESSCTIITIKLNGIIQSVDKNCCKLFGYTLEELIGQNVSKIIPHPYHTQHDTYLENYKKTKVPKIIGKSRVVEGQHKDGSIFAIKLSVSKIENHGQETFVLPTSCGSETESESVCPIRGSTTSQRRGSKVSNDDDTLFIGIIDKLEDSSGTITIDPKGIIVACNSNVKDIFGYNPSELKGNNIKMLMPSPHQEKHDGYIKNFLKGGAPRVIGHTRNVPAVHKRGNVFPISLQVEPVSVGPMTLFRGKIEKVNEMEAIFVLDKTGQIVSCNQNFVQPLFGYSCSELVGQNISMLIPQMLQKSLTNENCNNNLQQEEEERNMKRMKTSHEKQDSWRTPGFHKKELHHKDGSLFPVILEITTFHEFNQGTEEMYSAKIRRADSEKRRSIEKEPIKMIGDYLVSKTLGRGSYGKVKLANHKTTKEQVAIKTLQKTSMPASEMERAMREIKIIGSLNHPNIVKFHEMIETESAIHIVMEYGGRTLLSYVLERNGLGEQESRAFFIQILKAVAYCHERNIIHRDIKHQNILLNDQAVCKLIDFGLSQYVEEGMMRSTFCGTPAYASPQMVSLTQYFGLIRKLLGKKYVGHDIDVWSLGVVLYSMITGAFPFDNIEHIMHGTLKKPANISDDCFELMQWMLQVDPTKRATLQGVLEHRWLAEFRPPLVYQTSSLPESDPYQKRAM